MKRIICNDQLFDAIHFAKKELEKLTDLATQPIGLKLCTESESSEYLAEAKLFISSVEDFSESNPWVLAEYIARSDGCTLFDKYKTTEQIVDSVCNSTSDEYLLGFDDEDDYDDDEYYD